MSKPGPTRQPQARTARTGREWRCWLTQDELAAVDAARGEMSRADWLVSDPRLSHLEWREAGHCVWTAEPEPEVTCTVSWRGVDRWDVTSHGKTVATGIAATSEHARSAAEAAYRAVTITRHPASRHAAVDVDGR